MRPTRRSNRKSGDKDNSKPAAVEVAALETVGDAVVQNENQEGAELERQDNMDKVQETQQEEEVEEQIEDQNKEQEEEDKEEQDKAFL